MMGEREFGTKLYYQLSLTVSHPRTTYCAALPERLISPSSGAFAGRSTAIPASHRPTLSSFSRCCFSLQSPATGAN